MAKLVIDTAGTTDTLAAGLAKANSNFTELYDALAALGTVLSLQATTLDASANPNYPAASAGYARFIGVAGKVGGASGKTVEAGDLIVALATNAGGTEASVGTSWLVLQSNLTGITATGTSLMQAASAIAAANVIDAKGADIASASTLNLDNATGSLLDVTGTTTITAITLAEGRLRFVRFTGGLTLTHGASLVLPAGGSNIVTVSGDIAVFAGYAAGVVRCLSYQRLSGKPLVITYADVTGAPPSVATPNIWHVSSAGNDGTADGSVHKPYLTAGSAYFAALASGVDFQLNLGVGSFNITLTGNLSSYCKTVRGAGGGLTVLELNGAPSDAGTGSNGYAVTVEALDLTLTLNLRGGHATGTTYETAGTGGSVYLTGRGIVNATLTGGNGLNPDSNGGNGGNLNTVGDFFISSFSAQGGSAGGVGSSGGVGSITADGADLTSITGSPPSEYVIAGRCRLYSGYTPTTDKGGNSTN